MEELLTYCHSVPDSLLCPVFVTLEPDRYPFPPGLADVVGLGQQRVLEGHCQKVPLLFLPPPAAVGGGTRWGRGGAHFSAEVGLKRHSFHALLLSPQGRIRFLPRLLPCAPVIVTASSYHFWWKSWWHPLPQLVFCGFWVLAKLCLIQALAPLPLAVTPITSLQPTIHLSPEGQCLCAATAAGWTGVSGLVLEVPKVKQNLLISLKGKKLIHWPISILIVLVSCNTH